MGKRAGPLSEISADAAEISASGLEIFPYEHSVPPAGMKNVKMRMRRKLLTKNTRPRGYNMAACSSTSLKKRKHFRWDSIMIEHLIDSLLEYKSRMSYKSIDFDADRPIQYKEMRLSMANIYMETDASLFGPICVVALPSDFDELTKAEQETARQLVKESKELIAKTTKRVMEKVKEIRQSFSKAVVSGSRSGSGKIVYEFYDKLILLWGGSASTSSLAYGVSGDDFEEDENRGCHSPEDYQSNLNSEMEVGHGEPSQVEGPNQESDDSNDIELVTPTNKRKANCVTQLIDNNRKHLERSLSASQRDQLLIKEAKEDAQFRKDLSDAMRQSTETFAQSIKDVSKAMTDLGAGDCR